MAETVYHGRTCSADFGSAFSNVTGWTCTVAADSAESHAMHTTFGKLREVGFKSGTATVATKVSGDNQFDEGDSATLTLVRSTGGGGYSGAAICIGVDVSVDKDDVEIASYSFQFTSTIT